MNYGRSPELQKRVDEYRTLEATEVERIKSEYPTETIEQMIARLQSWQSANDFIEFVKPRTVNDRPSRNIAHMAAEFGFRSHERGDNMQRMFEELDKLLSEDGK